MPLAVRNPSKAKRSSSRVLATSRNMLPLNASNSALQLFLSATARVPLLQQKQRASRQKKSAQLPSLRLRGSSLQKLPTSSVASNISAEDGHGCMFVTWMLHCHARHKTKFPVKRPTV